MCFFDQTIYVCGDYKWGNFRMHCSKEYRTGETCGMKLIHESHQDPALCKTCQKIVTKQNRWRKEYENIQRWQQELLQGHQRQASIEKAYTSIKALESDVEKLQRERMQRNPCHSGQAAGYAAQSSGYQGRSGYYSDSSSLTSTSSSNGYYSNGYYANAQYSNCRPL